MKLKIFVGLMVASCSPVPANATDIFDLAGQCVDVELLADVIEYDESVQFVGVDPKDSTVEYYAKDGILLVSSFMMPSQLYCVNYVSPDIVVDIEQPEWMFQSPEELCADTGECGE